MAAKCSSLCRILYTTLNYRVKAQNVLEHYMWHASCSRSTSRYSVALFSISFFIFYFLRKLEIQTRLCYLTYITLQLGTVHLCRSVIRSIETARIFDFEEFPKRDKVIWACWRQTFSLLGNWFQNISILLSLYAIAGDLHVLYWPIGSFQWKFPRCK